MNRIVYRGLLAGLAYVFLLDGFVRLGTGSSQLTLARDVLPWGVALLGLGVLCVRHTKIEPGPLFGLVAVFIGVSLVELFNPDTTSVKLGFQALRQHLEFVPLFFIAYAVIRTEDRLHGLALLFVIAGAANGVVGLIQSQLTPAQLGTWGSGYHALVTTSYAPGAQHNGRIFIDASGHQTLRPPALGGDAGFGGVLGMYALPFALALALEARHRARRWVGLVGIPLIAAAVITSQTRAAVVAAVIGLGAFLLFVAGRERRRVAPAVIMIALGIAVLLLFGGDLGRYDSITPTQLASTFGQQRGGSFDVIPAYVTQYPFGAGLGTAGPAAGLKASVNSGRLSGENGFSFLLVELGLPGLLCALALFAVALRRGALLALSRRLASERLYLAAITSGLIGCAVLWLAGGVTAAPPLSPFIWLAFGVVAAAWTGGHTRAATQL